MAEAPQIDDFDTAFAAAAQAVETTGELPPPEAPPAAPPVEDKAGAEFADAAAKEAVDAKAAEDKAAADKAAADQAVADKAAADQAVADAKKAEEDMAAADKEAADKAAADKAVADAEADKGTQKTAEQLAEEKRVADEAAAKKAADDALAKAALADKGADTKTADQLAADAKADEARKVEEKRVADELAVALADYKLTDEEVAADKKWREDFPGEALAIDAQFRRMERQVTQRVYNAAQAVIQLVYKDIAPLAQSHALTAEQQHFKAIREAHPDFDEVKPQVGEWIKTQPAYLRPAMEAAYAGGTTDAVIDLFKQYKGATGKTAAPPAAPPVTPPAAPPKPGASKEDIDAGLPVSGKRTMPAPKGGVDPNDFDGAFAEATAAGK